MDDNGVYYYRTVNRWMTSSIFFFTENTMHSGCQGQVSQAWYCLLRSSFYLTWLKDINKDCKIVFLPTRTTSLVQLLLDQELITTMKQFYYKQFSDYLCQKTDGHEELLAFQEEEDGDDIDEGQHSQPTPSPAIAPPPSAPEMLVMKIWHNFDKYHGFPAVSYLCLISSSLQHPSAILSLGEAETATVQTSQGILGIENLQFQ